MRVSVAVLAALSAGCASKDVTSLPPRAAETKTRVLVYGDEMLSPQMFILETDHAASLLVPRTDATRVLVLDYDSELTLLGWAVEGGRVLAGEGALPLAEPKLAQELTEGAWAPVASIAPLDLRAQIACPKLREQPQRVGELEQFATLTIPVGDREALVAVLVDEHGANPHSVYWRVGVDHEPIAWPPVGFPATATLAQERTPAMFQDPTTGHAYIVTGSGTRLVHIGSDFEWIETRTLSAVPEVCGATVRFATGGSGPSGLEVYSLSYIWPEKDLSELCRLTPAGWESLGWRSAGGPYHTGCSPGVERFTMRWKGPGKLELAARQATSWTYDMNAHPEFLGESVEAETGLPACRAITLLGTQWGDVAAYSRGADFANRLVYKAAAGWELVSTRLTALSLVELGSFVIAGAEQGVSVHRFTSDHGRSRFLRACPSQTLAVDGVDDLIVRGNALLATGRSVYSPDGLYISWLVPE